MKSRGKDVAIGIVDSSEIEETVLFPIQEKIVKVLETLENVKTEDAKPDTDEVADISTKKRVVLEKMNVNFYI